MATIQITIPDQRALVARSAGLLTPEKIEALFQVQIEKGAGLGEKAQGLGPVPHGAEKAALVRLITIASTNKYSDTLGYKDDSRLPRGPDGQS